jgi:hypothetical protein
MEGTQQGSDLHILALIKQFPNKGNILEDFHSNRPDGSLKTFGHSQVSRSFCQCICPDDRATLSGR